MALITRKQGYLFFPLLTLEGLNLHFTGRSARSSTAAPSRAAGSSSASSPLRFAVYLGAIFWMLPLGMAFAFIGVQLAVFGVYMGASFAPNHKGMPIIAGRREARLLLASRCSPRATSRAAAGRASLMGGLNYQVEHHLFPNMPRPHLAKAREIVREHCPHARRALHRDDAPAVVRHRHRVPQPRRPRRPRPVRLPDGEPVPPGLIRCRILAHTLPPADVAVGTPHDLRSCTSQPFRRLGFTEGKEYGYRNRQVVQRRQGLRLHRPR